MPDKLSPPPKNEVEGAETVERGRIVFLYRPIADDDHIHSTAGVQLLFIVLSPTDGSTARSTHRLIQVNSKTLPDAVQLLVNADGTNADRPRSCWAYVERVVEGGLRDVLEGIEKTEEQDARRKGHGTVRPARPCGVGNYAIVLGGGRTRLCYKLRMPGETGAVQTQLNIRERATFVLSVKKPADDDDNDDDDGREVFPDHLLSNFGDHTLIPAVPSELLDHRGASLVLVACSEGGLNEAQRGSGVEEMDKEMWESLERMEDEGKTLEELGLPSDNFKSAALLRGEWI